MSRSFEAFKNRVKSCINKSRHAYHRDFFQRNRTNLRNTWSMIKTLASCPMQRRDIKTIFWSGREYLGCAEVANAFNEYFCNIPVILENNLPRNNLDPLSYIGPSNPQTMFLMPVLPEECRSIINNLKLSKQPNDHISVKIFKTFSSYLCSPICDIINHSFFTGVFPDMLKVAEVVPVFKSGETSLIENYRPISILHFISKTF